ncbi:hypothetical protein C8R41DRAFT_871546 [Lentinula lateritia]|uniref:Uncharacterized protein n=1 Tax=Lentinula lateritia TaxID=40482 RepID=A0ABQ8UZC7_9AGAR|nr:hypothetical protein C8R41DRAFT_871546 [Lentinula lateritia]
MSNWTCGLGVFRRKPLLGNIDNTNTCGIVRRILMGRNKELYNKASGSRELLEGLYQEDLLLRMDRLHLRYYEKIKAYRRRPLEFSAINGCSEGGRHRASVLITMRPFEKWGFLPKWCGIHAASLALRRMTEDATRHGNKYQDRSFSMALPATVNDLLNCEGFEEVRESNHQLADACKELCHFFLDMWVK